jgi:hypothetical protein
MLTRRRGLGFSNTYPKACIQRVKYCTCMQHPRRRLSSERSGFRQKFEQRNRECRYEAFNNQMFGG